MSVETRPGFLRVAITGGIGSGKTTVCRLFSRIGRTVISADDLAHRIADEDPGIKKAVVKAFGPSSYLPNGLLDRKAMAALVFVDEKKRQVLDSIIHPRVFEAIDHEIASLPFSQSHPYVLIEAALVYETGMNKWMDYVIVVTADEEDRIQRVMARDRVSREDVLRRTGAQMPMEKKVQQADFVLTNSGPMSELNSTVSFLDSFLSHIASTGKR